MDKDYYKILGLEKDATEKDIKEAFRRLAHVCHPDKNNGDARMFKDLNDACRVLLNKEKRAEYDKYYYSAQQKQGYIPKERKGSEHKDMNSIIQKTSFSFIDSILVMLFIVGVVGLLVFSMISENNNGNFNTHTQLSNLIVLTTESEESLGEVFENERTNGDFKRVNIKIENVSQEPVRVSISDFEYVDSFDRKYSHHITPPSSSNDCYELSPYSKGYRTFKPSIPCEVSLIFEVAKDSQLKHINFQMFE